MSSLGDLLNSGIRPKLLTSPALAGGFFTTNTTWKALRYTKNYQKSNKKKNKCISQGPVKREKPHSNLNREHLI